MTDHSSAPREGLTSASDPGHSAWLQLGGKLAAARVAQGLSQSELAARLHLGASQLDALESGDRDRLPEVVFVIAHARRVAASLGIDLESELSALRGSPSPLPSRPATSSAVKAASSNRRLEGGQRLRPLLLLAGLVIALAAAVPLLRPLLWKPGADAVKPSPSRDGSGKPQATAVPPASIQRSAPKAPVATNVLVLSSQPASWVAVRDQAGTMVFEGNLQAEKRFPLGEGLQVLAGRPDLVRASLGAEPAKPLGAISDVQWRSFAPAATSPSPRPVPEP